MFALKYLIFQHILKMQFKYIESFLKFCRSNFVVCFFGALRVNVKDSFGNWQVDISVSLIFYFPNFNQIQNVKIHKIWFCKFLFLNPISIL